MHAMGQHVGFMPHGLIFMGPCCFMPLQQTPPAPIARAPRRTKRWGCPVHNWPTPDDFQLYSPPEPTWQPAGAPVRAPSPTPVLPTTALPAPAAAGPAAPNATHAHAHVHAHVHVHIHIHIHARVRIHIHLHIHAREPLFHILCQRAGGPPDYHGELMAQIIALNNRLTEMSAAITVMAQQIGALANRMPTGQ